MELRVTDVPAFGLLTVARLGMTRAALMSALRFVNDPLADRMVEVLCEVRLFAASLFQKALGRLRTFAL